METIKADSFILVYRDRRRRWLVRPADTPKLHTHLGILDCAAPVGQPYGLLAKTTMNDELFILKPTLEDIVMKFARKTQVIYPKDLAMIVMRCGIHSGSRVFEAGTGERGRHRHVRIHGRPAREGLQLRCEHRVPRGAPGRTSRSSG